jgi:hypothetical protein
MDSGQQLSDEIAIKEPATVTVNAAGRAARIKHPVNPAFDVLSSARVDACFAQSEECRVNVVPVSPPRR